MYVCMYVCVRMCMQYAQNGWRFSLILAGVLGERAFGRGSEARAEDEKVQELPAQRYEQEGSAGQGELL